MDTNTTFTKECLTATHAEVSEAMLKMGGFNRWNAQRLSSFWKAASVTCSTLAQRKSYFVEIEFKFFGRPGDRFNWTGTAWNAYEARDKAWRSWLAQQNVEAE